MIPPFTSFAYFRLTDLLIRPLIQEWMKDVSSQRRRVSQISQQQKTERVFFLLLWMLNSVESVWRVWVLGSRISSRWGCTDLEGPCQESWTKSGAYISLFTYFHPTVTFLTYLWSLLGPREQVMFHAKESIWGTSEGPVSSSVDREPLYCCRGDRNTVLAFCSGFLFGVLLVEGLKTVLNAGEHIRGSFSLIRFVLHITISQWGMS